MKSFKTSSPQFPHIPLSNKNGSTCWPIPSVCSTRDCTEHTLFFNLRSNEHHLHHSGKGKEWTRYCWRRQSMLITISLKGTNAIPLIPRLLKIDQREQGICTASFNSTWTKRWVIRFSFNFKGSCVCQAGLELPVHLKKTWNFLNPLPPPHKSWDDRLTCHYSAEQALYQLSFFSREGSGSRGTLLLIGPEPSITLQLDSSVAHVTTSSDSLNQYHPPPLLPSRLLWTQQAL